MRATVRAFVRLLALALTSAALATTAAAVRCSGADLLAEFEATSPGTHARIAAAAAATVNTSALLWRIEREGVRPSYLLGTIHLTDDRVTTFSPRLTSIIDGVEKVALEIDDVSPEAAQNAMAKVPELTLLAGGKRLDRLLSREHYDRVRKVLARAGVPEAAVRLFKPWVAMMIMSLSDCERRAAAGGAPVLDAKIAAAARERGKPVVGLETIESQLRAMASVPDDQQLDMLRVSAAFAHRIDDAVETLLRMYAARNIGAAWPLQLELAEKAGVDRRQLAGFEKLVVIDRNHKMAKAALPLLAGGSALIAVGALHLPGDEGLVALLRQAGYTLTPLE